MIHLIIHSFIRSKPHCFLKIFNVVKRANAANGGVKKTGDGIRGSDLVAWLVDSTIVQSASTASSVGQLLLNEYHLFNLDEPGPFEEDKNYQFRSNMERFSLNSLTGPQESLEQPLDLQKSLVCLFFSSNFLFFLIFFFFRMNFLLIF